MAETLILHSSWWLDLPLSLILLWVAWRLLATTELHQAVILFITFGLILALVWVRLEAVDVALAEAAIGSGLTGALFWSALARMQDKGDARTGSVHERMEDEDEGGNDFAGRRALRLPCGLLLVVVWGMMTAAILELPPQWRGLLPEVKAQLARSGVDHPVTAVLLNFRAYDTLLEIVVLFLAALGVWSLGFVKPGRAESPAGPVLSALVRVLLPILILVSAHLLERGATAPGGAFQAGAVLGTAGVLFLLSDIPFSSAWFSWPLKAALVAGPVIFLGVAAFTVLIGYSLLQYPTAWATVLIVLVESVATLSIAATLLVLFAGGRPQQTPPPISEPVAGGGEEV